MSTSNTPPLRDIPRPMYISDTSPQVIHLDCDGRSGDLGLEKQMAKIFEQAFKTFKERQQKYGSNNIAKRGAKGICVRLDDKLARLDQLMSGKGKGVADETTADTCLDIVNYGAMALICMNGGWPPYEAN